MLERYYRELSHFCARIVHSPDMAADIVQASYAQLSTKLPASHTSPRALLFATARQLILTKLGRVTNSTTDLGNKMSTSETTQHIAHSLQKLPRRRREAFMLHRFDGLSYADIAQRMRIPKAQVEQHVRIAMQTYRHALLAQHSS